MTDTKPTPREPTPEMVRAGRESDRRLMDVAYTWHAMWDAAPSPQPNALTLDVGVTAPGVRVVGEAEAEVEVEVEVERWQPIETAPRDDRQVLAGFKGQFLWVCFVARASHHGVWASNYAQPTHWCPLPEPPDAERGT